MKCNRFFMHGCVGILILAGSGCSNSAEDASSSPNAPQIQTNLPPGRDQMDETVNGSLDMRKHSLNGSGDAK